MGHEVVSLDISAKYAPTIVADILTWDYKQYAPGTFDYVHASCPCTAFSLARTGAARDFAKGDEIARHTLAIIAYLQPTWWSLENPQSSLIWKREFKDIHPKHVLDYCMYAPEWGYRKRTIVATNIPFEPKKCRKDCPNMIGGRHREVAQKGPTGPHGRRGLALGMQAKCWSVDDLIRIPPQLCRDLLAGAFSDER